MKRSKLVLLIMLIPCYIIGQGPIHSATHKWNPVFPTVPFCGSHDLIKCEHLNGLNEQLIKDINHLVSIKSSSHSTIYRIPVVFHIVHNNTSEDLADSVILNQLDIINQSFRRTNDDTTNTRAAFLPFVGDVGIEFYLADTDPNGFTTSGITRTSTSIEYFGGILPYGSGQTAQITQWVEDSLFYNYFRLTNSSLGGKDAWNTDHYLNIWIGDLRILEPQFNNFEEMFYFAFATPPLNHTNWPDSILDLTSPYSQGVLIHYVNVGSNNPNLLPSPYNIYNGVLNTGKLLVHETGHYLGLRHIWGDGDCTIDDFISDTPNSNSSSQWNCNLSANTCVDNIGGMDLHDMVENYMDYSSGNCQNAFTIGQGDLMRNTLDFYYPNLYDQFIGIEDDIETEPNTSVYPNPTNDLITLDISGYNGTIETQVYDLSGRLLKSTNSTTISLKDYAKGIYVFRVEYGDRVEELKVVKD